MWENMVQADRPQMAAHCGACALHAGQLRQEYKHMHSKYVIIVVFAGQKLLRERATTYIACIVIAMSI